MRRKQKTQEKTQQLNVTQQTQTTKTNPMLSPLATRGQETTLVYILPTTAPTGHCRS